MPLWASKNEDLEICEVLLVECAPIALTRLESSAHKLLCPLLLARGFVGFVVAWFW